MPMDHGVVLVLSVNDIGELWINHDIKNRFFLNPSDFIVFKARHFELVLRIAMLVRSPMGEEFSGSVKDRCQPNIVKNWIAPDL